MHVLLGGNRIYVEAALREQRCMIGRGPAHAGLDWTVCQVYCAFGHSV